MRRVAIKKNLFVINCEVKILEDWFLGQRDILQIKLEIALSVWWEELPSSCPLVFASSFRWSGFSFWMGYNFLPRRSRQVRTNSRWTWIVWSASLGICCNCSRYLGQDLYETSTVNIGEAFKSGISQKTLPDPFWRYNIPNLWKINSPSQGVLTPLAIPQFPTWRVWPVGKNEFGISDKIYKAH